MTKTHMIAEIIVSSNQLQGYEITNGLKSLLEFPELPHQDLIDQLSKRLMELTNKLTIKQKQILCLWLESNTITDISKELKVSHTYIHNCLYGRKENSSIHGGVFKKLKMICSKDIKIRKILNKIEVAKRCQNET